MVHGGVWLVEAFGDLVRRVGLLAGSFNPPTIAHGELLAAAAEHVDELVCVVPRVFPHKEYFGATLEQRVDMLQLAFRPLPYSVMVSNGGLFIDIAREYRRYNPADSRLYFLCGADAADRIMNWDYGEPGFVQKMLLELELLVAPRGRQYTPPTEHRDKVHSLAFSDGRALVSSTAVRTCLRRGDAWEHLVPETIHAQVRRLYR